MDNLVKIIIRLQNGDKKAFSELYKLFAKKVYKKCFMVTLNKSDAEDIFQEIWLKLYLGISTLNYPEKFNAWFQQLTARVIIDYSKKNKNFVQNNDETVDFKDDKSKHFDAKFELENILKMVSEEERMLLYMHYIEGVTFKEISEVSGKKLSTVKMKIYRAVEKIKRRLNID